MAKPTIVTRLGKGSELTFQEGDDNFTNLRDATISITAGTGGTSVSSDLNGELTLVAGTGISLSGNNTAKTITVAATTPTAVTVLSDDTTNATYYPLVSAATFGNAQPRTDSGFTYNPSTGVLTATTFSGAMSYTTLTDKPTIPTNNNELTNGAGYITGINSSAVTTALGFTPESTANKNANNGYAGLDSAGKVASAQLPSYVDDVVEAANYEALPVTGETGKIYVTLDINKTFRWSGSAYVEIAASPGTTDNVPEGTTNQYFTTTRARGAFSAGTGITITDGVVASTVSAGISDVVADTTPQLGGDLDVNGNSIRNGEYVYIDLDSNSIDITPGISPTGQLNINGPLNVYGNLGAVDVTATGRTAIKDLTETVYALTYGSTITPDVANGTVQNVTLTGNVTFSAFANPVAGQSITLIVKQDATGSRTLTSTMKFAGGTKTLTTAANSTDIISVFYDGTTYWASLGADFK
jgi:hypothetical protein